MNTPFVRSRAITRPRRGASVVEAAFVLPMVLIFVMGVFEYGRFVMTQQVLTNAAREGARYALIHSEPFTLKGQTHGNATSDVQAVVSKSLAGQNLAGQTIEVYKSDINGNSTGPWTSAASGELVCVKISGNFQFMVPNMLSLPATTAITARSIMRSEGN